jgi:urease gamma subunit
MIDIRVTVRGESDTPPFVRMFQYFDKDEESIFFNSVLTIKERVIYCAYVIDQVKDQKSKGDIEKAVHDVLSSDQVLIGVPETLREMIFDVIIDKYPKQQIQFSEPMKTSNYIMT